MANREQGEVSLDVQGRVYTLFLSTHAMCVLEERYTAQEHRPVYFDEVRERAMSGSVIALRDFVWAALLAHHPDLTIADAETLIDQAGGLRRVLMALNETATPDPEDLTALGLDGAANPRKAQARRSRGNGANSISTRGASA